jgi:hypothetical protein
MSGLPPVEKPEGALDSMRIVHERPFGCLMARVAGGGGGVEPLLVQRIDVGD